MGPCGYRGRPRDRASPSFGGASVEDWGGRLRDILWIGDLPGNGGAYGTLWLSPIGGLASEAPLLNSGGNSGNHLS